MKIYNILVAVTRNLPWSLSVLFSKAHLDKYLINSYHNLNLDHPWNVINSLSNWWVVKLANFPPNLINWTKDLVNLRNPWPRVSSETLNIGRQKRIALDWKGGILDLNRMTEQEISDYLGDENEIERQQNPGRRHRNYSTIRCVYYSLSSKQQAIESLKRIEESAFPKVNLKYSNVRVKASAVKNGGCKSEEINNNFVRLDTNSANKSKKQNDHFSTLEPNPEKKLLLFVHGGGFLTLATSAYESILTKIVDQLGGIPALSVDYSLTVSYPIPVQELLDVYLWIYLGKDDVKAKLGFHPKKIVISGDSCGGYYCLSLIIALNELNKMLAQSAEPPVPLPVAFVGAYTLFSPANISPSLGMQTVESLVCSQLIALGRSIYGSGLSTCGDFKRIEKTKRFKRIATKNESECIKHDDQVEQFSGDDTSPWFHCSYPTFVNRADYLDDFFVGNPLLNPLLYRHQFDQLKGIELFLFVGKYDFLLDQSIELARLWKGSVCLDVFDKLLHGFLQIHPYSTDCSDAFEVVVKRYQEACGLI